MFSIIVCRREKNVDKTDFVWYHIRCKGKNIYRESGNTMSDIDISSEKERFRIMLMLDRYGSLLTEKQRDTLELYFQDDLSLSEISELKNISRQGVRENLWQGIRTLVEYEEKLGIVEKTERLKERLEKFIEEENLSDAAKSRLGEIANQPL